MISILTSGKVFEVCLMPWRASEQTNGDGKTVSTVLCLPVFSEQPPVIPTRGETLAFSTQLELSGVVRKPGLWTFSAETKLKQSLQTLLEPCLDRAGVFCISSIPVFLFFNKSPSRSSIIEKVWAICEAKPFLRLRQTRLSPMKTVIMRRSIMLEFLLFVGAFTSVCQWISHL